jgi:hypothetical protein
MSATTSQTPDVEQLSAEAIWEDTQGNPFFFVEMLRHLRESGVAALPVALGVPGFQDTAMAGLGVPEGVREVVGHRVARMSDETGQVVVEEASGLDKDDVLAALDEAERARLVVEVPAPVPRDRFAHALVRTAVYDGLSAARRQALHRRLAEAIERVHAGRLDDYLPALAHHYGRAYAGGAVTKAVDYAARAGERALGQLAQRRSGEHYHSAPDVLDVAGAPDTDPQRLEPLLGVGEAQIGAGDSASRQTLLDAARVARRLGNAPCLAPRSRRRTCRSDANDDSAVAR